jgi:hypothetical protein
MMKRGKDKLFDNLPGCAADFIKLVIKKMRYRKKIRDDVRAELAAHFEDELRSCKSDEEKEQKAKKLIEDFGDAKMLAVLLRRAKKRCRPMWQKVLIRSLTALGIIIVYILLCSARLIIGTPSVAVDYTVWLSELARAGRDESLNARPYFDKAVELAGEGYALPEIIEKSRRYWPGDMNEAEKQATIQLLTESQASFDALKEGVEKPYYWADYTGEEKLETDETLAWELMRAAKEQKPQKQQQIQIEFMSREFVKKMFEHLAGYRKIARRLALQVLWKAYNDDIEGALSDAMVLHKFSKSMEGHGLLSEQLVAISLEGIALVRIFTVLNKMDVPADVLKMTQQKLQEQCDNQRVIISFQAEKVYLYDYIQRTFTDDGKGGGRVLKEGLPLVVTGFQDGVTGFFFGYPDRREVTDIIDKYFEEATELLEKTPFQMRSEGLEWTELDKIAHKNIMLQLLRPAHSQIGQIKWRLTTDRSALLATLAALRYEKENGAYPEDLEELVSRGYLKKLPMDPWSGRPLVYRKTDDGFTLYSVGLNFTDDGGKVEKNDKGKSRVWGDKGDAVFWPVSE